MPINPNLISSSNNQSKRYSDLLQRSNSNKSLNATEENNSHMMMPIENPSIHSLSSSCNPKKISNLKKQANTNSAASTLTNNNRVKSGAEKVKFSDIEMHHMITSHNNDSNDNNNPNEQFEIVSPSMPTGNGVMSANYAQFMPVQQQQNATKSQIFLNQQQQQQQQQQVNAIQAIMAVQNKINGEYVSLKKIISEFFCKFLFFRNKLVK